MPITSEQQKSNRLLWAKALRSGKYKQGKGCLEKDNKFCCLGVACKLFHTKTKVYIDGNIEYDYSLLHLSIYTANLLGITVIGTLKNPIGDDCFHLESLNDDKHYTFSQIADLIEQDQLLLTNNTNSQQLNLL